MFPLLFLAAIFHFDAVAFAPQERVAISDDQKGFVLVPSGERFVPSGYNYDHDEQGRLLEDYWDAEWSKVESDFSEMKQLGGRVIRVHLQFGKFMDSADRPIENSLHRLTKLADHAASLGLYLNLTGLACYHKKDVPAWYDQLSQEERWRAQANFWRAIARSVRDRDSIFCYDLMNEPVVSGGKRADGDWLGPAFAGKHFVQFISLDPQGRARPEIAKEWIGRLVKAIREEDPSHLITLGMVDWSLDRPGLTSGFDPTQVSSELDFISVHLYPETNKIPEARKTIEGFAVGKPIVVEETFPLRCSIDELLEFQKETKEFVAGWVSFYWGKDKDELRRSSGIADAILLNWLERFRP